MRRSATAAAGAAAVILAAGVAVTQTAPPGPPPERGAPVPTAVALTPDRAEAAALAQARQDPMGARMRGVLSQGSGRAVLTQIEAADVPVLGPADPALMAGARFIPGEGQHTLVLRRNGTIFEIHGTRRALQSPAAGPLPPPLAPPGRAAVTRAPPPAAAALARAAQSGAEQIRVERTEYGMDASFSRFGAAYNLSIICAAPGGADCTEAAALDFIASLVLLGGGR